jgi:poly(hydroxyalkanoate) granule-associated protein
MTTPAHSTPDPATDPSGAALGSTSQADEDLARVVKASAQEIWLAGMGAFAKAQQEGQRVFEALVKEGTQLQQKTQSVAEQQLQGLTGKLTAVAADMGDKAQASWDKLESIFETRTAKALQRLGVPTAAELAELRQQVQTLSEQLQSLKTGAASSANAEAAQQAPDSPPDAG